jgi:hypothetical protein
MRAVLQGDVVRGLGAGRFLVSEFFEQEVLGVFEVGAEVDLGLLGPHSCRQLRIAPWNGRDPVLAGTDLHLSGGGVEVAAWQVMSHGGVSGAIDTPWDYPVHLTVAFPSKTGWVTATDTVSGSFTIAQPSG